jgi:hypothetical protein
MKKIAFSFPLLLVLAGCATRYSQAAPLGRVFPAIVGNSLDGRRVEIPAAFAGRPVLLLVGYEQMSQFDIDRWVLGLDQLGVKIESYELPTIAGIFPGLFSGSIDSGMRSGIPKEDWPSVITVYGDASTLQEFVGNDPSLPARVALLNAEGRVVYFHGTGYSLDALKKLKSSVDALRTDR